MNLQPATTHNQGTPPAPSQRNGQRPRPRHFWPRALPLLVRHIIKTMPWVTLIGGCLTGTAILAALAYVAHKYHSPLSQTTVRLTLLPAIATLAFVPHNLFRPLTQATPVPAWLTSALQTFLAIPVLAVTCWIQLSLSAYTVPAHTAELQPAIYPLLAQLTAWSAIFVAVAACSDRSRYADIGGAIAVPISLAAIALAWFIPAVSHLLVTPPATPRAATVGWYIMTAVALALTYVAMRDRWHRYADMLPRSPFPAIHR